ncbi:MAG TPA: filamentous hemagglutinin N-terminal domain-containing protein [Candidatus Binatia bacterium]|nr:filamentous hemagglutinin N-terminal domain-containing protein [Candidatus Binatia bacterium]
MRGGRFRKHAKAMCGAVGTVLMLWASSASPAPTGLSSQTPGVSFSGVGTSNVTITSTAQRSIINAQGFNIAHGETASVIQPNTAAMLIRIGGQQTFIDGTLNAMGLLYLLNPNGILFGQHAQVNVGGIIASSLHLSDANFLAGNYVFQGTGIEGAVKNAGVIRTSGAGAYLFAPNVENSGVITSPGGNIVLGAGKTAYLSYRPDGTGFLAKITAPTGQAVNVKDLVADGGYITMAGRVVNQSGLIQANSVRAQNGKIELLASEALTLADGSRTLARGGSEGISVGGTIRAMADLKAGTATFAKGALIDVSGGQYGGDGGLAEVSGQQVTLGGHFLGDVRAGYTGGRLLIDPVDVNLSELSGSGLSTITFTSPDDLHVTGSFDLSGLTSTEPGVVEFIAGQHLLFNNARLTNSGTTRWDYKGVAQGDIRLSNSHLATGAGGSIDFTAVNGNISLVSQFGQLSTVRTTASGGNITLTAGLDVISPTARISDGLLINRLGGIRLEGPGTLNIRAGNDFVGGTVGGILTGPGFVLADGIANVTAGRNIGSAVKGVSISDSDGYAVLTLGKGQINLSAESGSIYLGRVQDFGVSDATVAARLTVDPANQITLKAKEDIFLNPRRTGPSGIDDARGLYPASFHAETENGNIVIEQNLNFWPSPTGSVTLSAGKDVIGLQEDTQVPDPRYGYIFIGFKDVPGGHWQLVNFEEIPPEWSPFLWTRDLLVFNRIDRPTSLPTITVKGNSPTVTLREFDVQPLLNRPFLGNLFQQSVLNSRATSVAPHAAQPVTVQARTGKIQAVNFNFASIPYRKRVTIEAATDIEAMTATIGVPENEVATVSAGRNLNMRTAGTTGAGASSDLTFAGTGTAKVRVGGLLDLADSTGINFRYLPEPSADVDKGGFLDIEVGGRVKMDQSRIATYNGATLSIHGPGTESLVDPTGKPIIVEGKPLAVEGTVVSDASNRSVIQVIGADGNPKIVQFEGTTVVLDGATTITDPLTLHLSVVEQGGKLLRTGGTVNGEPFQVVRAESSLPKSSGLAGFDPVLVDGHFILVAGNGSVYKVPANVVTKVRPIPEAVTVGSSATNAANSRATSGTPLGILTLGGGAIDVFAKGDIDVETSRISTFHGGDINLTSTHGRINAGNGSRDEAVEQVIEQLLPDGSTIRFTIRVPASGISTFHRDDPRPLRFIEFQNTETKVYIDPEIEALRKQEEMHKFFGHDTSALVDRINQLRAEREPIFNETVLKPFIANLKLGDAYLAAERVSVDIPPAGIQARTVEIHAPTVNFQGGTIRGNVIIPPTVNVSGPPSISGTGSGAAAVAVTPVSGSSATASAASTSAAVSTSAKSSDATEAGATETITKQSEAKQVASKSDDDKKKTKVAQSIKMKHGVIIQVDVKPQPGP